MTLSSRDPVTVARVAERLIQSGHWAQQIANDPKVQVMMSLRARMPWAVGHVPVDGLVALTKAPPPGGCHWCVAAVVRELGKPELERNEVTLALLGAPCARYCQPRWAAQERAAELIADARPREALIAAACQGRPWLTIALARPPRGPGSLADEMSRDVTRMGVHRAATRWGIPAGVLLGERAALRGIGRHPFWGWALGREHTHA